MTSPKTIVLALPGTGYPDSADPITADFLSHFDSSQYETRIVPYPASFGGTQAPYEYSRAAGRRALLNAIASCDGAPIVLTGYSQGAVIAGDMAQEAVEFRLTEWNIRAVGLIADGYRPEGVGVTPTNNPHIAEGYGIAGQRPVPGDLFPTFWVSAWGDPIASLPAGNPLRTVADLVGWYSIASPRDWTRWGAAMLDTIYQRRLQDWWAPWKWTGWAGALAFARGYLFDGCHTVDYITEGYTRALAVRLQDELAQR